MHRIVNSVAPIRVCDNGGWTDTWFARYGKVFNIAVYPSVEVQIRAFSRSEDRPRVTIHAENYGESYCIELPAHPYDKHPLLEAALDFMGIPDDVSVEVSIFSEAPSGCSTGTSAAVSVALIAALDRLTPGILTADEIAAAAHLIESEMLKQQSGIQDQIASAHGGISFIDMHDYPHASVSSVRLADRVWWELEARLSLVYVGQTHSSSAIHEIVIRELEDAGPEARQLQSLRNTAEQARNALLAGDFEEFGRSMIANTRAQRELHPNLVGERHRDIIDLASRHGAIGWKVNGAGGSGGSVTLLSGSDRREKRAMLRAIEEASPAYRNIPISLARLGVRTWVSEGKKSSDGIERIL